MRRAGANARRRRNKKARDFTDFLTQKSTPLSTYLLGERQSSQYSRRGGKWDRGRKWAAIFPSALNLKVSRGFQQLSCLFGEVCFRRIKIGKASSISVGSSKEMECKLVGGILLFHFEYNLLPLIMSDLGRVTQ